MRFWNLSSMVPAMPFRPNRMQDKSEVCRREFQRRRLPARSSRAMTCRLSGRPGKVVRFGHAVAPLHRSAPMAAKKNSRLYEVLALIDAVRVGGAREREVGSDELRKRLS